MHYDLSISWNPAITPSELQRTISFASTLGYDTLALDHVLPTPIPSQISNPIPKELSFTLPSNINILRRCTVVFTDPSQNYRLPALSSAYDILALRPTNEKAFLAACTSIQEHSLISLDLTYRFPFHFRPKPLMAAVNRGIRFELSYTQATAGQESARRNVISNCMAIFRATRGRGLVLSSGAKNALGLRGPADVVNLMGVWGLGRDRAMEALDVNPRGVVVNEGLKRTSFRGVVNVVEGGKAVSNSVDGKKKDEEMALKDIVLSRKGKRKFEADKDDSPQMSKRQARKVRNAQKQNAAPQEDKATGEKGLDVPPSKVAGAAAESMPMELDAPILLKPMESALVEPITPTESTPIEPVTLTEPALKGPDIPITTDAPSEPNKPMTMTTTAETER